MFWQVTGTGTAGEVMRLLQDKGFHFIRVVSGGDNLVRIMVGPYSDQASLDHAKDELETAGFHPLRVW